MHSKLLPVVVGTQHQYKIYHEVNFFALKQWHGPPSLLVSIWDVWWPFLHLSINEDPHYHWYQLAVWTNLLHFAVQVKFAAWCPFALKHCWGPHYNWFQFHCIDQFAASKMFCCVGEIYCVVTFFALNIDVGFPPPLLPILCITKFAVWGQIHCICCFG